MSIQDFSPLWGNWKIGEVLGKGTYGTVYKISKEEYGKTYYSAVKHISIPANEQEKEQLYSEGAVTDKTIASYYKKLMYSLQEEIKTCYRLKGNSYIVSYEDHQIIPKKDGIGYDILIRMELLKPLSVVLRNGSFNLDELLKLGIDICFALETLEREKIIHRDIKPSNIFVSDIGQYKLGDFGVARELSKVSSGLSVKGTYKYMPPEILRGGQVNFNADIYSLGLVLYRLLNNNRSPFVSQSAQISYSDEDSANKRRLSGEKLPPPINADANLAAIVLKACEYNPNERWRTPTEFRRALESYRENKGNASEQYPDQDFTVVLDSYGSTGSQRNVEYYQQYAQNYDPSAMSGSFSSAQPQMQSQQRNNRTLIILFAVLITLVMCIGVGLLILNFFDNNSTNSEQNNVVVAESADTTVPIVTEPQPGVVPTNSACEQFVLLESSGASANLYFYQKVDGYWSKKLDSTAIIGRNGTTDNKHEGDGCTPRGEYGLPFCFGYNNPSTNLKFFQVNSYSEWNTDQSSDYYNTLQIEGSSYKSEKLKNYFGDNSHSMCIYVAYNGDGLTPGSAAKGKGSMITICGMNYNKNDKTAGAIHIAAHDMTTLLSYLDSSKNPVIIIR